MPANPSPADDHDPLLGDRRLQGTYARSRGPIAFVDESAGDPWRGQPGFYTMTAVLFDRAGLREARAAMQAVNGARAPWHTNHINQTEPELIQPMVQAVADHTAWTIITIDVPIWDPKMKEAARDTCLRQLLIQTTKGDNPDTRVQLIVCDHTNTAGNQRDQATANTLRHQGLIPDRAFISHSSDDDEIGLWAPDAVGWAVRRTIAADDAQWVEPVSDLITLYDARDAHAYDWEAIRAAAQSSGAHDTARTLVLAEVEETRSGISAEPQVDPDPLPTNTVTYTDLLARVKAVQSGGLQGPGRDAAGDETAVDHCPPTHEGPDR